MPAAGRLLPVLPFKAPAPYQRPMLHQGCIAQKSTDPNFPGEDRPPLAGLPSSFIFYRIGRMERMQQYIIFYPLHPVHPVCMGFTPFFGCCRIVQPGLFPGPSAVSIFTFWREEAP